MFILHVKMGILHIKGKEYLGFFSCNYLNFSCPSSAYQMPLDGTDIYTKLLSNVGQT